MSSEYVTRMHGLKRMQFNFSMSISTVNAANKERPMPERPRKRFFPYQSCKRGRHRVPGSTLTGLVRTCCIQLMSRINHSISNFVLMVDIATNRSSGPFLLQFSPRLIHDDKAFRMVIVVHSSIQELTPSVLH